MEPWSGWQRPLSELPVVVVDLETTGLDPRLDRIVELALIVPGGPSMETLVRPARPIGPDCPHGLTEDDLRSAPSFRDVAGAVCELLDGRIVVAHHAVFDVAFLCAELRRAQVDVGELPFLCTATLPALLGVDHPTRRLGWACEHYGITLTQPHEAFADAEAALQLYARYRGAASDLHLATLAGASPDDPCVRSWRLAPYVASPAGPRGRGLRLCPRARPGLAA
jgi:DNA polymerase-3 subunit epsilon